MWKLNRQISVNRNLGANKFGEIFWGEVKIDAWKGGGRVRASKTEIVIITSFPLSNRWNKEYNYKCKYPSDVQLHRIHLFKTYFCILLQSLVPFPEFRSRTLYIDEECRVRERNCRKIPLYRQQCLSFFNVEIHKGRLCNA